MENQFLAQNIVPGEFTAAISQQISNFNKQTSDGDECNLDYDEDEDYYVEDEEDYDEEYNDDDYEDYEEAVKENSVIDLNWVIGIKFF